VPLDHWEKKKGEAPFLDREKGGEETEHLCWKRRLTESEREENRRFGHACTNTGITQKTTYGTRKILILNEGADIPNSRQDDASNHRDSKGGEALGKEKRSAPK